MSLELIDGFFNEGLMWKNQNISLNIPLSVMKTKQKLLKQIYLNLLNFLKNHKRILLLKSIDITLNV